MISLQSLNQAVCDRYRQALDHAGTAAPLLAEDVSGPIIRPSGKVENLAVRQAVGEAFLAGITVEDTYLGIDEGISFTVTDGVLVATLDLTITEPIPEADGEPMETLEYREGT